MQKQLHQLNIHHFAQAQTAFTSPHVQEIFGKDGCSSAAQRIIYDRKNSPSVPHNVQIILYKIFR